MKTELELISIKEYAKKKNISEQAIRKQIATKKITSVLYNNITYVVVESIEKQKNRQLITYYRKEIKQLNDTLNILKDKIENDKEYKEEVKQAKDKTVATLEGQVKMLEKVVGLTTNLLDYKQDEKIINI